MSNKKQIKITKDDLIAIYDQDYYLFEEKILPNCYCVKCGSRVNRYLETGEVPKYQERIKMVKENLEKVGFKV